MFASAFASNVREFGQVTGPVQNYYDAYWLGSPPVSEGDSGGPLYIERADGSRDPIGLVSGRVVDHGFGYAKLSRADVQSFVLANAVDVTPTANWFRRHGKVSGQYWYGETDYVGPCDTSRDTDCDHWYLEHDNCPEVFNVVQEDADDDGVGDACDSCPTSYDPAQKNCNSVAENAEKSRRNVTSYNDVCDPVPCAQAERAPTRKTNEVCVPASPPFQGQDCTAIPVDDTAKVTAVGSYPISGGPVRVVPNVTTEFRFCQNVSRLGLEINCARNDIKVDDRLQDAEVSDDPNRPWHRVTIGTSPYAQPASWTYGQTVTSVRWNYVADSTRWFAGGQQQVALPDGCSAEPRKCLDGVFWYHASTSAGVAERGNIPNLANRYERVHPENPPVSYCPLPTPELAWIDPAPSPARVASTEIAIPGYPIFREFGFGSSGATLVVPTFSEAGMLRGPAAILRDDGSLISASSTVGCGDARLEPGLAEHFVETSWASVIEPNEHVGVLPSDLVAIGLDGTAIVTSVSVKNHALVDSGSPSLGGDTPPGRTAPVLVLSRAAGGLFLLGGTNTTDSRSIYFHSIPGRWAKTDYELPDGEEAVAATFSYVDHRLWLLMRNGTTGKLLRADLTLGTSQTIADFPLREGHRPSLAIDRDGSVVVARGGPTSTSVIRFQIVGSRVRAQVLNEIVGSTIRGPIVDESSYTFILRAPNGTLAVHHTETLTGSAAILKCPNECSGLLP